MRTPLYSTYLRSLRNHVQLIAALCALCLSCESALAAKPLEYQIINTLPHDDSTFTQGFIVHDNDIIESSGLYRKSYIRRYNKVSNEPVFHTTIPAKYFAEGITKVDNTLFVLTWKSGTLLRYNLTTQRFLSPIKYSGQGWGLTYSGSAFIMSDGSDKIHFRKKADFSLLKSVSVHDGNKRYSSLNELEFAEGHLWANVWQTSLILRINAYTGDVTGILDLSELSEINQQHNRQAVLNGIAYDPEHKAYWVTGKYWPNRYLITITQ